MMNDKLQNLVANLAGGTAKSGYDRFVVTCLSDQVLEAMYRGSWISRKVVDLPVSDMLRPWRCWQAEGAAIEAIEAAEKRHHVRAKLALAMTWARLYGGATMIIGADVGNPMKPLNVETLGKDSLKYITVLPRRMTQALERELDPRSPLFGEPKAYRLNTQTSGPVDIHPSRVLRFIGAPRPDVDYNFEGWGDSVLQVVYDAVHNAELSSTGIAELIHEAKVDVIKMDGLSKYLSTEASTLKLTERFTLANTLKSINNMLLLDKEDEWDRKQTSFAGLTDILAGFMQIVAGAADIPATRLLGTSPKGLNATGESDLRNYYDMLDGQRTDVLRPKLEFLDQILWRDALGAVPKDAFFTFNPLWQMTAKEKSDIGKVKAETAQIYANLGLLPDEPLAQGIVNGLIEDEVYPGLEAEIEKYLASGASLVPEEEPDADVQPSGDGPKGKSSQADHLAPGRALTGPRIGPAGDAELARAIRDELDARARRARGNGGARGLSH